LQEALQKRLEISEGVGSQVFIREGIEEVVSSPRNKPSLAADPTSPVSIEIPNVAKSVWQGSMFWKIPYSTNSIARKRWFQVMRETSNGDTFLMWSDPAKTKEKPRGVNLNQVTAIKKGHSTTAFFNQVLLLF
jgi:hypothetical protein